jgi:hypothetical protein
MRWYVAPQYRWRIAVMVATVAGTLGLPGCGARRDESAAADSVAPAGPPPAVPALPTPIDSTLPFQGLVSRIRARPEAVLAVSGGENRAVTAVMRDGRRYHSTEPTPGALAAVVRSVDPSGSILIAAP